MAFTPKPGCPMCGIVDAASHSQINSHSFNPTPHKNKPDILWKDDNFTVYRETANPVSSIAHVIVAFNSHIPTMNQLSPTDLPLLLNVKELAVRYLNHFSAVATPPAHSPEQSESTTAASTSDSFPPTLPILTPAPTSLADLSKFRIGFITPPFRDTRIPVTDHLHAHAYVEPADLMSWWRSVAYGPFAWYAIDDLVAEIREETSNNRIRSSVPQRVWRPRPIDHVPTAGARTGHANGAETTKAGLGATDANLEDGEGTL